MNFCLLDHDMTRLKNLTDTNDWLSKTVLVKYEDYEM